MWVLREFFRLVLGIAVASAIAILIAGVWALIHGGDFTHSMRIMLLLFGCLLIVLAGGANRNIMTGRMVNWQTLTGIRSYTSFVLGPPPTPEQPTLSPLAVFLFSGIVVLVLGVVV